MRNSIVIISLLILLFGCGSPYILVEPQRTEIGNSYTVKSQIPWSQEEVSPSFVKRSGKVQIWTVDGPRLQEIRFVSVPLNGKIKLGPFEIDFVTEEGLEKSGFVVGSIIKEKLYLIIYSGARVHYFAKHKKHVEDIIESVQMKD